MIFDNIVNVRRYFCVLPGLEKAVLALRELEDAQTTPGRHDIDGDEVYASVQSYDTAPAGECAFEHHRRFIDVQYLVSGTERIDFCPRSVCETSREFDESNDYELCREPERFSSLVLSAGDFAVLYPGEAHRPKVSAADAEPVRKIVFKIRL